jgi:hypothetical protein
MVNLPAGRQVVNGEYELLIAQHPNHLQTVSINEAIVVVRTGALFPSAIF